MDKDGALRVIGNIKICTIHDALSEETYRFLCYYSVCDTARLGVIIVWINILVYVNYLCLLS